MDCRKESRRLKRRAHQILPTLKPATRASAKRMIMALMINRKSPNVTIVTGRVRITKMGFTKKFNKLSIIATIIAVI
jgi:hypothetical protein